MKNLPFVTGALGIAGLQNCRIAGFAELHELRDRIEGLR
jgi:hypothetical protein